MLSQYLSKIFIGICYGISFPLTITILDYWLKDLGISNALIGLFSFIHWPFMLKFLWGPIIENFDIPLLSKKMSRYKSWMTCSYLVLILGIVIMANSNPTTNVFWLIFGASLVAIADGCKNIVLYPYQLIGKKEDSVGFIASCVNLGNRLGSIFIKVSTLYVAHFFDWRTAYLSAALMIFFVMIINFVIEEPHKNFENREDFSLKREYLKSFFAPIKQFLETQDSTKILAIVGLYKSADFMMQKMSRIFCIEVGFSKIEIANIIQFYGSITVIVGSFLGGYAIKKLGLIRSMRFILSLHAISFFTYLLLTEFGKENTLLTIIITFEALSGGAVTSCFIAFFYTIAADLTIYAVLWALYELSGLIFMSVSGIFANLLGWKLFFCFVPMLVIPNLILLRRGKLQESGY
ncbi:MAG: MFS transporter [Alphaproteobacteria bacterium]|nr:MFS transporter [Alphaproteobacteria bacterium]